MRESHKKLVDIAIRDLKPYLDFLRDYDRGKVTKKDLRKLKSCK